MKQNILRRSGALLLSLALVLSFVVLPAAAEGEFSVSLDQTLSLKKDEAKKLTPSPSGLPVDHSAPIVYTWTSDDETVAKVSEDGTVTGLSAGEATITVTAETTVTKEDSGDIGDSGDNGDGGDGEDGEDDLTAQSEETVTATATCTVTVTEDPPPDVTTAPPANIPVTEVVMQMPSLTLAEGETETLAVDILPENATDRNVSWTTSNEAAVTVDQTGKVTAVAEGEATITATVGGKSAFCMISVTPRPAVNVSAVNLGQKTARFDAISGSLKLSASVSPSTADDQSLTWRSDDEDVATVDEEGVVRPVGPGEAKITVTSNADASKSDTCTVVVSGIRLYTADGTKITPETTARQLYLSKSMELSYKCYGAAEGVSLTWSSSDNSIVYMTNGRATARSVGTANVTASGGGYTSPVCVVQVVENTANIITGSVTAGVPYDFDSIRSSLDSVCREMTKAEANSAGSGLRYITNLMVSPDQGVLYYNYVSTSDTGPGVGGTERYYYTDTTGERSLTGITFIPKATYSGTATITYTGYSVNNESYSGIIRLTVQGADDVNYETRVDSYVTLQAADFNNVCRTRTGRDLSYITLELPSSNRGMLYYGYTGQSVYSEKVASGTQYYRTRTPYIEEITFVPAEGYVGTVQFNYRAMDTAGDSYSGRVTINVTDRSMTGTGDVRYPAVQGERVTFKASDFNSACQSAIGETLNYVRFELPTSSQGVLYYKYTNSTTYDSLVSASTRYYRTGSTNALSSVTFVPASTAQGNVAIRFTAYGTGGGRYDGTVTIQYSGDYGDGLIPYTTQSGVAAQFDAADFNEMCQDITGRNLNYVVFDDLPTSSQGNLYYNYSTSSASGSKVSTSTRCYRNSTPSLSRVAFVPKAGYKGVVEIGFTAVDAEGFSFDGIVSITVEEGSQTVRFTVRSGGTVAFDAAAFNNACRDATGGSLNYVRFELPSTSQGTLYYKYDQSSSSKVSSSTSYYRTNSSRLLEDVSFVAAGSYTGTVEFEYTGYSTGGVRFSGIVEITVYLPTASNIRYSGGVLPVALLASDLDLATSQVLSEGLSYIQFTSLPDPSAGRLYSGYTGYDTGTAVTTDTRYYYNGTPSLDQLSFLAKAGYTGTVSIGYTATDAGGNRVTGTVSISISNDLTSRFLDMGNYSWAAPSVEFLYQNGVVNGISATQFGPEQSILRRDFVVMLCRTFDFDTGSTSSFQDVPAGSYYARAVASAKDLGIVTGSGGLFMPDSPLTRQDAMVMLQRALSAAGKPATGGTSSDLAGYSDSAQISDYARNAVASMIRLGLVQGNSAQQLTPRSTISRAEMSVIMHRVMTQ